MNRSLAYRSLVCWTLAAGWGCGGASGPPITSGPADAAGDVMIAVDAPVISPAGSGGSGGASPEAGATGGSAVAPLDAEGNAETSPPADGGGGARAPGSCTALFCDSFEDIADGAPPNPAIWTRTSNDIVVDSTRAANGGKKSLHIPPLMSGAKYIRENKTIAAMGKAFYGRLMFWIDKQPTERPARLYHWTLLEADEGDSINAGRVLRLGGHIEGSGTNWLRFNFETHGNPGETGLSDQKAVLATKRWYCAEFYFSLTDNEARFWLDGVEDPTLHWKGPMGGYTFPAAISWMTFGWAEYQATVTPWELWIDEIALDTKKIGCGP